MNLHLKGHAVLRADQEAGIGEHHDSVLGALCPPLHATAFMGNDDENFSIFCFKVGYAGTQQEGLPQANRSSIAVDENE